MKKHSSQSHQLPSNVEEFLKRRRQQIANHKLKEQASKLANRQKTNLTPQKLPTILSVDDSKIVQVSIKRALQETCEVLLSNNALNALKTLNSKKVDLLLLDVTMPDMDGLQMCRTLRTIPKFKELPIVMVTARDTLVDQMKGKLAGTTHYLTKPFNYKELREIVHNLISSKKTYRISA